MVKQFKREEAKLEKETLNEVTQGYTTSVVGKRSVVGYSLIQVTNYGSNAKMLKSERDGIEKKLYSVSHQVVTKSLRQSHLFHARHQCILSVKLVHI